MHNSETQTSLTRVPAFAVASGASAAGQGCPAPAAAAAAAAVIAGGFYNAGRLHQGVELPPLHPAWRALPASTDLFATAP